MRLHLDIVGSRRSMAAVGNRPADSRPAGSLLVDMPLAEVVDILLGVASDSLLLVVRLVVEVVACRLLEEVAVVVELARYFSPVVVVEGSEG